MVEQRGGPRSSPPGVKLPEARGGEAVKLAIARESGLVADFVIAALTGLPQALVTLLVLTAELALGGRWLVLVGGAGLFLLSVSPRRGPRDGSPRRRRACSARTSACSPTSAKSSR